MNYPNKIARLLAKQDALLSVTNTPVEDNNGIYTRYKNPVLTHEHIPIGWRYDLNPESNPFLMERIGGNATMNSGAIKWNGKYLMAVRVEGIDRKSFLSTQKMP